MGSRDELAPYNQRERAAHPEGETQLYPSWQQSQYLHMNRPDFPGDPIT
jgi:hypothetical protein